MNWLIFREAVSLVANLVSVVTALFALLIVINPTLSLRIHEWMSPRYYISLAQGCFLPGGGEFRYRGPLDTGHLDEAEARALHDALVTVNIEGTPLRRGPTLSSDDVVLRASIGDLFKLEKVVESDCQGGRSQLFARGVYFGRE